MTSLALNCPCDIIIWSGTSPSGAVRVLRPQGQGLNWPEDAGLMATGFTRISQSLYFENRFNAAVYRSRASGYCPI
jgi:hypothetical protein